MRPLLTIILFWIAATLGGSAQTFTSYRTGRATDTLTQPAGGICMMGGAAEEDTAMAWFLQRARGGDVLVLRTTGGDGYNSYLYSTLGVGVHSVETIVFHQAQAAAEPYVHKKIRAAEAIWLAGGDQWDYVSYWRGTAVDSLINQAVAGRQVVIGGTSAGMAILGGRYFSAENGTVTSASALADPYRPEVKIDSTPFLRLPYLRGVIPDTHYDNPDRKGRHAVFLARSMVDYGLPAKGIACDEYTAVCIDSSGQARVFGQYPAYDDNAYFLQVNCERANPGPERCSPGNPLEWDRGGEALQVYAVKGTPSGSNGFDVNEWDAGTGGVWQHWYVRNGVLMQAGGHRPQCSGLRGPTVPKSSFQLYPNPARERTSLRVSRLMPRPERLEIRTAAGALIRQSPLQGRRQVNIPLRNLPRGVYVVRVDYTQGPGTTRRLVIK